VESVAAQSDQCAAVDSRRRSRPLRRAERASEGADTVIVLDFALWRCAWRAARRSRENLALWPWLISYRRRSLPTVLPAIAVHACDADVYLLRGPRDVQKFLARVKCMTLCVNGPEARKERTMGNAGDVNRGLVAPSDIADLAGVTRAAVSNWRRRRSDFPEPAGGTVSKPLSSRHDVERWLVANGHQLQRDSGELAVWAVINRFRDEFQ
jgi:hypothetical protein